MLRYVPKTVGTRYRTYGTVVYTHAPEGPPYACAQCCGSGAGSVRIRNYLQDPDPYLIIHYGSGSYEL